MPFVHGKSTAVWLGAIDLSPYLNSVDLGADLETADTTTFAATWKSAVTGIPEAKADYAGLYDPARSDLPAMILSPATGVLTYCPVGGGTIGNPARMAQVHETSYAESSPVGGAVAVKGSFAIDGPLGIGVVLHPLAEDTNTTTGADRDDAAATTTGWIAHLHVTAVDAGSWVIKLQDAATLPTYADVTGASFTAVTGAASQRLVSAAVDTTLRRYVRYVATRTGGSAGDGITFALAYSRNR